MDRTNQVLDNPNLVNAVPTYALYGESPGSRLQEALHCESLAERSRLYGWEIKPHQHASFFQLVYVRSGRGEVSLPNSTLKITPPCLISLPARSTHGFVFSPEIDGVVITIVQRHLIKILNASPRLPEWLSAPQLHAFSGLATEGEEIGRLIDTLVSEFRGTEAWRLSAVDAALVMVLVILARSSLQRAQQATGTGHRLVRHLNNYRILVNRLFRTQRSIGFYSAELGITPTQLNRICRQLVGMSALNLISLRILQEAERDLVYSSLAVKDIALGLGFGDTAYFSRFFAKHMGVAPSEYRLAARDRSGYVGSMAIRPAITFP